MSDEPVKITLTRMDDVDVISFSGNQIPREMMYEIGQVWAQRELGKPVVLPGPFEVVDLREPHA